MEVRRTVPVKLDVADSDADQNGSPRESPTLNEANGEAVSE